MKLKSFKKNLKFNFKPKSDKTKFKPQNHDFTPNSPFNPEREPYETPATTKQNHRLKTNAKKEVTLPPSDSAPKTRRK